MLWDSHRDSEFQTLYKLEEREKYCQRFKLTYECKETAKNPDYGYTSFDRDQFYQSSKFSFDLL